MATAILALPVHKSLVPEDGFEQPKTPSELFDLAYLSGKILFAALQHLEIAEDYAAYNVLAPLHHEVVQAQGWILDGKWVGA